MKLVWWRCKRVLIHALMFLLISSCNLLPARQVVLEPVAARNHKILQTLHTSDFSLDLPTGMIYLPKPDGFLVWDKLSNHNELSFIGKHGEVQQVEGFPDALNGSIGAVFDPLSGQLILLKTDQIHFLGLSAQSSEGVNLTDPGNLPIDISGLGLIDPAGFTRDAINGDLYILDNHPTRIIRLNLGTGFSDDIPDFYVLKLSGQLLGYIGNQTLCALAFNPESNSLFTLGLDQKVIYEISLTGNLLSTLTLTEPSIETINALIFAPGVNQSDDPLANNLFILGSIPPANGNEQSKAGEILELTLHPTNQPIGVVLRPSYLVSSFATNKSLWTDNSPDPSGIAYLPETGELLLVDSEVDEFPPLDTLPNVFYATLSGKLNRTANTYKFDTETSGVAVNPLNNHYFFSDDNVDKVFELDPGPDNILWTLDDIRTDKSIEIDAEDITFGNNTIFVAGGNQGKLMSFGLGADGIISLDDEAPTTFDTDAFGFSDLEGISFNAETGTLFIISTASRDTYLGEFSLTGRLLNAWDLAYLGGSPNLRSGLTFAPASANPSLTHLYIVSRGIDNNDDPEEDDGKVTEISLTRPEN